MTAQELKNSILQLAVQGKLVPQDKNDEPASELLKRIQAEKAQLIKDGKLKKEKALPPITEEELPFDIPESWVWTRLGEIGAWGSGATPSKSNSAYYNNATIPWLVTGDLNDSIITEIPGKITEKALKETSVKLNPKNSVLMAMYGATIGKVGLLTFPATTNQACCACQAFTGINLWYLMYFLMSQRKAFIKRGEGGAQPNISKEKIVITTIPLPPLSEQQRIVDKIEELLPFVEEYGKAETRLKELNADFPDMLRKSILQQAVQGKLTERDPADEPASELLKRIQAEKAQLIKDGKIKKEKPLPLITEDEIPFDIPDTWQWIRLNVCTPVLNGDRGKNYPAKATLSQEGIPFISALNLPYTGKIAYESPNMLHCKDTVNSIVSIILTKGEHRQEYKTLMENIAQRDKQIIDLCETHKIKDVENHLYGDKFPKDLYRRMGNIVIKEVLKKRREELLRAKEIRHAKARQYHHNQSLAECLLKTAEITVYADQEAVDCFQEYREKLERIEIERKLQEMG